MGRSGLLIGPPSTRSSMSENLKRCAWPDTHDDLLTYHDEE